MSSQVLTTEAAKKANFEIIENGIGTQAVHDAVVALQANRRSGTANTKSKSEVSGTGAKPWRQKGTGRARAGYKQSPIWRGGAVAFGPKPRDYSKKVPKNVKRLAFRKALSSRIVDGDVLTVENVNVAEPKTQAFLKLIKSLSDARKVIVVATSFDDNTYLAARNVKNVLLTTPNEVNTENILYYDKILVTEDAFALLAQRSAK